MKLRIIFFSSLATILPFFANAATSTVNINSVNDVEKLINKWVGYLISLFWIASVVGMIYAAFLFLDSKGEPKKVEQAKAMVKYTIIAVVVALFSTSIKSILVSVLNGK